MGYSTLAALCGFVYGFPAGMLPAYIGALSGAMTCFFLARKMFGVRVRTLVHSNPNMLAVVKAVDRKGFKVGTMDMDIDAVASHRLS